jgi:type IV pilus assembly protein PilA
MIVVAIIAFLAMIAVPNYNRYLAKAKRAEAYMQLSSLYAAQKAYYAENGRYTDQLAGDQLAGQGGAGWEPEGNFYYTYGFPGSEGANNFTGKLGTSSSYLSNAHADGNSFVAIAAGDIDGDGYPDIIAVDQFNNITVLQDDLA